jgi:hypothetical protein
MAEIGKVSEVAKRKAINRVKKQIVPVSDATPHVKVLVYGRSKHGKTRFAASGPKTIVVDINEKGTRSIRSYPGCFVYRVSKWEQLSWVYWYLREGNHEFQTVVIDTLTQAQQLCMRQVLKDAEDRDPNRPPSMPRRQDWGQMGELMKMQILNYRNLEMNVVFVCQERIDKGSDGDEEATNRRVPDLSPSVRGIALAAVEIIGRVYQKEVRTVNKKTKKETTRWETRMLVGAHEDYDTGNRAGAALPRIIRNPTMQMMIEASTEVETTDGEE